MLIKRNGKIRTFSFLVLLFLFGGLLFKGQAVLSASDSVNVNQVVEGTVTPPEPPVTPPPSGPVTPPPTVPPQITSVQIYDITSSSARVYFTTDLPALSEVYYSTDGTTWVGPFTDHPESYGTSHNFYLSGLSPDTFYRLKLRAVGINHDETVNLTYDFRTQPVFMSVPNVINLTVQPEGNDGLMLQWQNPIAVNFAGVQIVRSTTGFPASPTDGTVVFRGAATQFTDKGLNNQTQYYYTVFSYDANGNFSSGAGVTYFTNFHIPTPNPPVTPPDASGTNQDSVGSSGQSAVSGGRSGGGGNVGTSGSGVVTPDQTGSATPLPVNDVRATLNSDQKTAAVSWQNPTEGMEVVVRKTFSTPALTPFDGILAYSGFGSSFSDPVAAGENVFYTVFVKNFAGVYSAGRFASLQVPTPAASHPAITSDNPWQKFSFIDTETGVKLLPSGDHLAVLSGRGLGVSYDLISLPAGVEKIAVRLNGVWYFFQYNSNKKVFETNLTLPTVLGDSEMTLVFLGKNNQAIYQKTLLLDVKLGGRVFEGRNREFIKDGWSGELLFCSIYRFLGRPQAHCREVVGLGGVQINIWRWVGDEKGEWQWWNAGDYKQKNPLHSDENGYFHILFPQGKYKLEISKDGYESFHEIWDENSGQVFDRQMEMKKVPDYRNILPILLLIILFLLILWFWKRRRKRKNIIIATEKPSLKNEIDLNH